MRPAAILLAGAAETARRVEMPDGPAMAVANRPVAHLHDRLKAGLMEKL